MSSKLLVSAREARASIGVGVTKFYELLSDQKLDARKIGRRTFITSESLRAFVDGLPRPLCNSPNPKSGDKLGNARSALPKSKQNQSVVADSLSAKGARDD